MEYGEIVQARIEAEIKQRLERIAERRRVKLSEVVRLALFYYVEEEERKEREKDAPAPPQPINDWLV
jgi:predicted transcriptional regulator